MAAPVSPSDLGGAKVLPGDTDAELGEASRAEGRLLHLLLERLPALPAPERGAAGLALAGGPGPILDRALDLIGRPALSMVFSPLARAEVALTATLPGGVRATGTIDRLLVEPGRVLAVDFKSNRLVPDSADAVPEGLLRQMGAYQAMLEAIYPDRPVEVALLWTATARWMPLPRAQVMSALLRATIP